jgi:hypothetical protein
MDLLKTKMFLDKLNREFARLSKDPEEIARIDVDIMLSYVRDLYDALLADAPPLTVYREQPATRKPATVKTQGDEGPSEQPSTPPPSAPPAAPPPPKAEEIKPEPAPPPPPPPPAAPPPPPPSVPVAPETPTPAPAVYGSWPPEAEALFEEKQAKELSEKLSELPIADLRRGIALNDRLLLTRELFAGDGQAFDTAIQALNGFSQFEEARGYLLNNCVIRYSWLDKKRIDAAKNFIKLVRRRYK